MLFNNDMVNLRFTENDFQEFKVNNEPVYFMQLNLSIYQCSQYVYLFMSASNEVVDLQSSNSIDFNNFHNQEVRITYKKIVFKLLEKPFESGCIDYKKINFESKSDCISKCKIELENIWCVKAPEFKSYHEKFVLVKKDFEMNCKQKNEIFHECRSKCQWNDCEQVVYLPTIEKIVKRNDASKSMIIKIMKPRYQINSEYQLCARNTLINLMIKIDNNLGLFFGVNMQTIIIHFINLFF